MINELVIHLGDTKTGSTSIQKALVQKAYEVPGSAICYPTTNHHNALARTLNRKRFKADKETRFTSLYRKFSASQADIGIVSAEHFQFVDPEEFSRAMETYWPALHSSARLIVYVRPHHEKLLSSFSERVKLGQVQSGFGAFAEDVFAGSLLDYLPRLRKWREVFGDRFEVRPFVRSALYQQDVIKDFFRFTLGHDDFAISGPVEANSSLTLPQLALLRLVHQALPEALAVKQKEMTPALFEARSTLGRTVSEHFGDMTLGADGPRLRLPASLTEQVQARYAEDAAALDAEFFEGTPMSDALAGAGLKASRDPQPLEASEYFAPETVAAVQAMARIMAGMLAEHPKKFLKMAAKTRLMFTEAGLEQAAKNRTST